MTTEQFCYWLQGKLEGRDILSGTFTKEELQSIKEHLQTVFKKVTPSITIGSGSTNVPYKPMCTCNSLIGNGILSCPVHPFGPQPSILC